ncbi:head completion/stabilization protein [Actinobacillus equuli subsp. haemolyticus]|uniref:head completion/stabilization protein n=1 Tax=Actinobacillus equuli TaxID=718 RepID=UPI00241882EB|nr:head completion/stabilization protein [Actinobacillus equuli]MDG4948708.1 head completion/stabilization protein [Actinobacillus equuli subsp. haemolyticus]
MSHVISIPKVQGYETRQDRISETDEIITNNGFYPDINLNDVRNGMRIDGTITNERLKIATIEAIASVNQELAEWRKTKIAEKPSITFAAIESEMINGESILVQRYRRAVYCLAVANLNERYRAYDSTKEGRQQV